LKKYYSISLPTSKNVLMGEISSVEIIFIGVVVIQLVYWLIWLIGVTKIKKVSSDPKSHGVSVIIAAKNELANLEKLLPTIFKQNHNLFEIIIIDDRSSDGSYEFLRALANEHANLKVITVSELPSHLNAKKYAITLGIKAAKYEQILLTDADCQPLSENWIRLIASKWEGGNEFVLGFSSYLTKPGLLNYFIRFETMLTGIQYLGAAALGAPYMGVGRNLSYSKSLFLGKKGFHGFQDLMGGDDDVFVNKYARKSNVSILLSPESAISSIPKSKLSDFFIQKTRHLSVGKHYSSKSKIILGIFTLSWILTWGLLPFEIISTQNLNVPIILFLGRYVFMGFAFVVFKNKSGAKLQLLGLIVLDFMFVLYYFATGIRALLTKRIKWS